MKKHTGIQDKTSIALLSVLISLLLLFLYGGFSQGLFAFVHRGAFMPKEGDESLSAFAPSGEATGSMFSAYEDAVAALSTSAERAALLLEDGRMLYGKNENTPAGMASTTKIMTAYLAAEYIESVGEDKTTIVSQNAAGIEGSSIYLKVGEKVRLIDLLYATLLASANDGAAALAEAVAGDIDSFVMMMNKRAEAMGLVNTHFENPHGLASEGHYTTAYELGLLAAKAMKHPLFARVAMTRHYTFSGEGMTRSLSNHNRMLSSYEGTIGVKTGFTKATGRCLVTAASRDGVTLIAVTLNAPDDWADHRIMLDYGFSMLEAVTLAEVGEFSHAMPLVGGVCKDVLVSNREALSVVLPKERGDIVSVVELADFAYAPVRAGDTLGRVVFYENEKEIASIPLVAKENVEALAYEKSFAEKILSFFGLR